METYTLPETCPHCGDTEFSVYFNNDAVSYPEQGDSRDVWQALKTVGASHNDEYEFDCAICLDCGSFVLINPNSVTGYWVNLKVSAGLARLGAAIAWAATVRYQMEELLRSAHDMIESEGAK